MHIKKGKNVHDVDPLVDATVRLADEASCIIKELLPERSQEKVVPDSTLRGGAAFPSKKFHTYFSDNRSCLCLHLEVCSHATSS
jgi:hypothetical protein